MFHVKHCNGNDKKQEKLKWFGKENIRNKNQKNMNTKGWKDKQRKMFHVKHIRDRNKYTIRKRNVMFHVKHQDN